MAQKATKNVTEELLEEVCNKENKVTIFFAIIQQHIQQHRNKNQRQRNRVTQDESYVRVWGLLGVTQRGLVFGKNSAFCGAEQAIECKVDHTSEKFWI